MKHRAGLLLLGGWVITSTSAQVAPSIQWQTCLGGTGGDEAHAILETVDGGYVVAGSTNSNDADVSGAHGARDFWVVKLDGSGGLIWQGAFGGSASDGANSVHQTNDGGYIVAGYTASSDGDITGEHGEWDFWVVKLDGSGALVWERAIGGSGEDVAYSIAQTSDDGYVIAGYSASSDGDISGGHGGWDCWVVKLDSVGEIEWQRAIGGSDDELAASIQQTSDGGFIVAGYTWSSDGDFSGNHGQKDYWIAKLSDSGSLMWQRILGGSGNDEASSILQSNDGGFIVAGSSSSSDGDVLLNHGIDDCWVVKLDAAGSLDWQRSLGGSGYDWAIAQPANDGGYVLAGASSSNDGDVSGNHGSFDLWAAKLDQAGNPVWQRSIGGSAEDRAYSTSQTSDGGYVFGGVSSSIDGDVSGNHGYEDFWVVRLDSSALIGIEEMNGPQFTLSPNPGHGAFQFECIQDIQNATITLTDALGREVLSLSVHGPEQRVGLHGIAEGLYLFTLRTEYGISSKRVVIE